MQTQSEKKTILESKLSKANNKKKAKGWEQSNKQMQTAKAKPKPETKNSNQMQMQMQTFFFTNLNQN